MSLGSPVSVLDRSLFPFVFTCTTGFDYAFNSIEDERNELFLAYKEMFEVAISQSNPLRTMFIIYMPFLNSLFVSSGVLYFVYELTEYSSQMPLSRLYNVARMLLLVKLVVLFKTKSPRSSRGSSLVFLMPGAIC